MARITVLGTGYVGLVTAVCFAGRGHEVVGYDVVKDKIKSLEAGEPTIYEPGVEELLQQGLEAGNLRFTDDLSEAIEASDILFVCVGTPQAADGSADLSQVEAVARTIAQHMNGYKLVVEKSTVPVKTAQWIRHTIELYGPDDTPFSVASNPEFLREGTAVEDFEHPDRIVLGVEDDEAATMLQELYEGFSCPILVVDLETAEMIKHASNSFLATKISFINMVSDLCEAVGADVEQVAKGMGLDTRIGHQFLNAGLGYGGSCFPKDVRAFVRIAEEHGVDFNLLRETDHINQARVARLVGRMQQALWVLRDKRIAVWGLAFKPRTDDVREAPSLRLIRALIDEGATVTAWDPEAQETFAQAFGADDRVTYVDSPVAATDGAHAAVVVTDWPQLRTLPWDEVAAAMETPILFDGRNHLDVEACEAAGLVVHRVGRRAPGRTAT